MTTDAHAPGFAGSLDPGARPVLLAVDLMRAYFEPDSPLCLGSRDCLESTARLMAQARLFAVPVVHARVQYAEDGLDGGLFVRKVPALRQLFGETDLGRHMPQVAPLPGELTVVKQYPSAFFGTSLASTLHAAGIDTVVVTGVSTSGCVRATALDALQHGFVPLVVREAVGDRDAGPHEATLYDLAAKYAEVVSEQQALDYLRSTS